MWERIQVDHLLYVHQKFRPEKTAILVAKLEEPLAILYSYFN